MPRRLGAALLTAAFTALAAQPADAQNQAPVLDPIQAQLYGAIERHNTAYQMTARDPEGAALTYAWDLQPPAGEPTCRKSGAAASRASLFFWDHDEASMCPNPDLHHGGVVTVRVSDGLWTCVARYNGTVDGRGPPPDPCTRPTPQPAPQPTPSPPPPTPPVTPEDGFHPDTKKLFEKISKGCDAAGDAAFGVAAIATAASLGPQGAATGPVAIGSGIFGIVCKVGYGVFGILAVDPPDPMYQQVSEPATVEPRRVRVRGVRGSRARLLRAQVVDARRLAAAGTALLHAVERAQGATQAGDGAWLKTQVAAAGRFASLTGDVLNRISKRRARTARLFRRPRVVIRPSASETARRLARRGLPRELRRILIAAGLSARDVRSVARDVRSATRLRRATTLADLLSSRAMATDERALVGDLRQLAADADAWVGAQR